MDMDAKLTKYSMLFLNVITQLQLLVLQVAHVIVDATLFLVLQYDPVAVDDP